MRITTQSILLESNIEDEHVVTCLVAHFQSADPEHARQRLKLLGL